MEVTNTKNNYIIKIKIINKIQCIQIHKNNIVLLYVYILT